MAKETKGGRRLAGSQRTSYTSSARDFSLDETLSFQSNDSGAHPSVDDAVVDEILRSISEQSSTPVPGVLPREAEQPVQQPRPAQPTISFDRPVSQSTQTARPHYNTAENSYAAAARAHQGNGAGQQAASESVPDPSYYAMRDPAHTQSFQPARPAHRDTDRIPTLVEEKPVRRKSVAGRILTFFVIVLVLVALVLGVRMAYLLGPSLGWDLPDLTQLPGVSQIMSLFPEEDLGTTVGSDTTATDDNAQTAVTQETPTSVTLDQETLSLQVGDTVVLTATTDTEWSGTMAWASSDESIVTVTPAGDNTAQIECLSEGKCSIAVVVPVDVEGDGLQASCRIEVTAASEVEEDDAAEADTGTDTEEEATDDTGDTGDTGTAEHIDIQLNREDFTLKVGESHQLMDSDADKVTWTSSDPSVASVSESGVVKAVSAGTATITATGPDGTTASAIARIKNG